MKMRLVKPLTYIMVGDTLRQPIEGVIYCSDEEAERYVAQGQAEYADIPEEEVAEKRATTMTKRELAAAAKAAADAEAAAKAVADAEAAAKAAADAAANPQ
jgi:hypothetical protein